MTITRAQVYEYETHRFLAEASDLDLAPGQTPRSLETTLGNAMPFALHGIDSDGNAEYFQVAGCISLTILND